MNIGTLEATLGVNTVGLQAAEKAMQRFEQKAQMSMANVQTSLAAVGARMQNFGRSATMYLTVPMALAGGAILKSAKDFEIAMQHIVGLVGVSQNQVNQWSKDILAMAPLLGRSPKELAEALYFITSSGIQGAAALDVLKKSAEGAASGLGETQAIADLVTSAMNAYKQSGLTAARIMDVFTAAVREGKGEAAMYASQMGEVIPIASLLGVSIDQVAASIAAVTLTGQNVSETVTGLRAVLFEILNPAKGAQSSLNSIMKMGDAFGYLRNSLKEKGLLDTLGILNDLTKKYGVTVMSTVFQNVRALTHALSLLGDRYKDNIGLFDRVDKSLGDHDRSLKAVKGTIDMEYNKAMANMRVGLVELGMSMKSSIIPILESMGNAVRGLASWYTNLSDTNKQLILTTAGLLAVIGPLSLTISVFAKLAANLFTTLSIISGPIGLVIVGFAGLTLGIVAVVNTLKGSLVSFENYKKSLETIGGSSKEFSINLSKEQSNIISLFGALRSANEGTIIRKNLIETINKKYGEYLPNLITEKTTLDEIDRIQKSLTTSMRTRMAVSARDTKINAIYAEQMRREQEYFNKFAGQNVPLSAWTAGMEEYATSVQKGTQSMKGEMKAMIAMSDQGNGALYTMKGLERIFSELYQYRKMDNKAIKETTNLYDAYIDKTEAAAIATAAAIKSKGTVPSTGISEDEKTRLKEIVEIMKNFTEKENSMALMNSLMGSSFATSEEKAKLYMDTLVKLGEKGVKPLDSNVSLLLDRIKALNVVDQSLVKIMMDASFSAKMHQEGLGKLNTKMYDSVVVSEKLREKLAWLAFQSSFMGDSFDQTSERIRILREMIKTLYDQQKKDPTVENIKNLKSYIDELGRLEINQFEKDFADIAKKNIAFGNVMDTLPSQINLVKNALNELWEKGYRPGNPVMDDMISRLRKLETAYIWAKGASDLYNDALNGNIKTMEDFGNALREMAIKAIATWVAEILVKQIFNSVQSSKNPWMAIVTAAAAVAATTALLESVVPKFAEGGTVPPGYPNDSYPAMLTSGEKVVPPQRLDQISRSNNEWGGDVEFRIRGDELYGVLKKHTTKLKVL